LLPLLLPAACASLLESGAAPDRIVRLVAPDIQQLAPPSDAPSLNFALSAAPGLDRDRLVTVDTGGSLGEFSGARWPDYSTEMIGDLVARSIRGSGGFVQVFHAPRHGTARCELDLELQEFHTSIDQRGGPLAAHIRLAGGLDCGEGMIPIEAEAHEDVSGGGLNAVVAALQEAWSQLTDDLLAQLQLR